MLIPDPNREPLVAVVGNRYHAVNSWRDVSIAYRRTIEALDLGSSRAPGCEILDSFGTVVAHVSYNGRVWLGPRRDWTPDTQRLYEPL